MKNWMSTIMIGALVAVGGFWVLSHFGLPMNMPWARGWGRGGCAIYYSGQPGGGDFQPQRGNRYTRQPGQLNQAPATSLNQ